ncbi:M56 family metallopeptidase [Gillisia sp. M10.2A]|uniref:M56 family metallopeptidase n=1 Tax=Gillisia lutea TaxID=2909668 RepID=A0ABS9EBG1_9FLAO|nr:M56 family metallopeptidase [Gillisia lutea]MCF4100226.1 M56 family metallopeptidase [Gillisia lutea]
MIFYILQVVFFQLLFLVVYEVLLKKETFFTYNRIYLLLTPIFAFILPLLKIKVLGKIAEESLYVQLPAVFINSRPATNIVALPEVQVSMAQGRLVDWPFVIYIAGLCISILLFAYKYRTILKLLSRSSKFKDKAVKFISIPNSDMAFTFFNHIFLGEKLEEEQRAHIVNHELAHARQYHSLDLLLFEVLKIIFWFNPLIYIYQARLTAVHEFIADEQALKATERASYYQQLLNTAFGTTNISFINQFFNHSLIKKRIVMLQKSKSKTIAKFKYLLVVPLLLVMLTYVSCTAQEESPSPKSSISIEAQIDNLIEQMESKEKITAEEKEKIRLLMVLAHQKSPETYYNKESNSSVYPYAVIDQTPIYPGCEDLATNKEQKDCMSAKVAEFVNKNFNVNLGKELGLTGMNRVIVQFKIDEQGNIANVKARAPHPDLEEEAKRVINSLPKMAPGKQDGKAAGVMYSLPIVFNIVEASENN